MAMVAILKQYVWAIFVLNGFSLLIKREQRVGKNATEPADMTTMSCIKSDNGPDWVIKYKSSTFVGNFEKIHHMSNE